MDSPAAGSGPLARSASLAGSATLASRLLGLAREAVLASFFGAGNAMDAFNIALRIPNLARELFAEGTMSAAFVPTFSRHLALHGKADAWRVGNNVINALVLLTGVLVVLGMIFTRPLVSTYAAGYASVEGKLDLTIALTRVMLPFLTLAAVAAAVMGMLNSLHHYFVPALAPAMFNVATIVCAFGLVPAMPALGWPPIMAIAVAVLLGGVGQVALQWPALRREGFRYRRVLDLKDPGLRSVILLMAPGTIGLAATQVNLFVSTLLATGQGTGAASWLTYAFRLMYLPIGLFGVSIATAVLPAAARHAALEDATGIRETLSRGLSLMLMLNVPATFGLTVLATPIVRLIFERGQFLPSDTAATASALQFYALGLVGYSAARITSPVFYALGLSRVSVGAGTASIVFNIIASLVFVRMIGFRGLALSTSLAAMANGGLLLFFLRRRLNGIDGSRLALTFLKMLAASLVMAAAAAGAERMLVHVAPNRDFFTQASRLTATIVGGLAALVLAAKILRIQEFTEAIAFVSGRVRKLLGA